MNVQEIARLLSNAGFHVIGTDMSFIYLEDPSCILRSFATFAEYMWIIITFITGVLIFGWAISMIRGSQNDIFTNLRNLILILCGVGMVGPIVNFIWGDDLFARGCKTIPVSIPAVQKILDARDSKFRVCDNCDLYENFSIEDSYANTGSVTETMEQTDVTPTYEHPNPSVNDNGDTTRAISAAPDGKRRVVYTYHDNSRTRYSEGSAAWRNTNPGNIVNSAFAQSMGAIGRAGRFAIFPSEQDGTHAISALLLTNQYRNNTIKDAISRYAPPSENDTAAYHRHISKLTGLDINRRISDLSPDELSKVVNAIRQVEGWQVGTKEKL